MVIDLCTGSGAIALSVADEVPGVTVHAVELSEEAAIWARGNIAATGLPVTLHVDDVTGDLATLSDLRGLARGEDPQPVTRALIAYDH